MFLPLRRGFPVPVVAPPSLISRPPPIFSYAAKGLLRLIPRLCGPQRRRRASSGRGGVDPVPEEGRRRQIRRRERSRRRRNSARRDDVPLRGSPTVVPAGTMTTIGLFYALALLLRRCCPRPPRSERTIPATIPADIVSTVSVLATAISIADVGRRRRRVRSSPGGTKGALVSPLLPERFLSPRCRLALGGEVRRRRSKGSSSRYGMCPPVEGMNLLNGAYSSSANARRCRRGRSKIWLRSAAPTKTIDATATAAAAAAAVVESALIIDPVVRRRRRRRSGRRRESGCSREVRRRRVQ